MCFSGHCWVSCSMHPKSDSDRQTWAVKYLMVKDPVRRHPKHYQDFDTVRVVTASSRHAGTG